VTTRRRLHRARALTRQVNRVGGGIGALPATTVDAVSVSTGRGTARASSSVSVGLSRSSRRRRSRLSHSRPGTARAAKRSKSIVPSVLKGVRSRSGLAQHATSLPRGSDDSGCEGGDGAAIASLLGQLGYETSLRRSRRGSSARDRGRPCRRRGARRRGRRPGSHARLADDEHERPAAKISALVCDESHRAEGIGRASSKRWSRGARRRCVLLFLTPRASRGRARVLRRADSEETGTRFTKTLD